MKLDGKKSIGIFENIVFLVVILLPISFYYLYILKYAINVPISDDYNVVPKVIQLIDNPTLYGDLSLLFHPKGNEHIPFFHRTVYYLYYCIFGDINFKWLCLIANLILIPCIAFLSMKILKIEKCNYLSFLAIIIPFIFSFQYWLTSLWSLVSIQIFGMLVMAMSTFYLLAKKSRLAIIFAGLLAFTCTFTMGNGLMIFPLGLLLISWINFSDKKWDIQKITIWVLMGVLTFLFRYSLMEGLSRKKINTSMVSFENIDHIFGYVFAFLGGSMKYFTFDKIQNTYACLIFGILLVIITILVFFIKFRSINKQLFTVIIFLGITSLGAAIMRGGNDNYLNSAIQIRYSFYPALYVYLLILIFLDLYKHKILNHSKKLYYLPMIIGLAYYFIPFFQVKHDMHDFHTARKYGMAYFLADKYEYSYIGNKNYNSAARKLDIWLEREIYHPTIKLEDLPALNKTTIFSNIYYRNGLKERLLKKFRNER